MKKLSHFLEGINRWFWGCGVSANGVRVRGLSFGHVNLETCLLAEYGASLW